MNVSFVRFVRILRGRECGEKAKLGKMSILARLRGNARGIRRRSYLAPVEITRNRNEISVDQ